MQQEPKFGVEWIATTHEVILEEFDSLEEAMAFLEGREKPNCLRLIRFETLWEQGDREYRV